MTLLPCIYHPSVDPTVELGAVGTQFYQENIGILRWAIELSRLNILFEVAILSQYLTNPWKEYFEQVYHIFGYLKQDCKRTLYLDPDEPNIPEERFTKFEWEDFYKGVVEVIPHNVPKSEGKSISLHVFVDSDHIGDKSIRRFQTEVLIFYNKDPII